MLHFSLLSSSDKGSRLKEGILRGLPMHKKLSQFAKFMFFVLNKLVIGSGLTYLTNGPKKQAYVQPTSLNTPTNSVHCS